MQHFFKLTILLFLIIITQISCIQKTKPKIFSENVKNILSDLSKEDYSYGQKSINENIYTAINLLSDSEKTIIMEYLANRGDWPAMFALATQLPTLDPRRLEEALIWMYTGYFRLGNLLVCVEEKSLQDMAAAMRWNTLAQISPVIKKSKDPTEIILKAQKLGYRRFLNLEKDFPFDYKKEPKTQELIKELACLEKMQEFRSKHAKVLQ